MKLSMLLFCGLITIILLISCEKADLVTPQDQQQITNLENARVIKNCLGSFLEIEDKYYLVCNESLVQNYPHDSQVEVTLNTRASCGFSGDCYLGMEYEDSVEILTIQ